VVKVVFDLNFALLASTGLVKKGHRNPDALCFAMNDSSKSLSLPTAAWRQVFVDDVVRME